MLDLILPKGYLSHSQVELWEKSKESYRNTYYAGKRFTGNMYTEFGNRVTLAMENNEPWVDFIPRFSVFEREFTVDIEGIPFKGSIDQFEPLTGQFAEQKTVMRKWSDNKIQNHKQFDRYSLAIQIMDNKVEDLALFIDARTEKVEKTDVVAGITVFGGVEMRLTGEVNVIDRLVTQDDRDREYENIARVGREIAEDFAALKHLYQ